MRSSGGAVFEACDERYFSQLGCDFPAEAFSQSDVANSRKFAVVNQTLAHRYFGRRIRLASMYASVF